jgi:hypothetical protein
MGQAPPLWALYGQDLELARAQLLEALACQPRLDWLQALTYLGCYREAEQELEASRGRWNELGRQILFRVRRQQLDPNPWWALVPPGAEPVVQQQIEAFPQHSDALVELVGGLGDVLESKAVIQASAAVAPWLQRFQLQPASSAARAAMAGLWPGLEASPSQPLQPLGTSTLLRLALATLGVACLPQPLWPQAVPPPPSRRWLVCWRCKPDRRNPLTAFSRSLPWAQIQTLMLHLQACGAEVLDLTAYGPGERAWLQQHCPTARLLADHLNGLHQTLRWLRGCSAPVISVDTSLVHLTALAQHPVLLLLPLFPDERWLELLQPGSVYAHWVTPLRQQHFHDWRQPVQELIDTVSRVCSTC